MDSGAAGWMLKTPSSCHCRVLLRSRPQPPACSGGLPRGLHTRYALPIRRSQLPSFPNSLRPDDRLRETITGHPRKGETSEATEVGVVSGSTAVDVGKILVFADHRVFRWWGYESYSETGRILPPSQVPDAESATHTMGPTMVEGGDLRCDLEAGATPGFSSCRRGDMMNQLGC